MFLHIYWSILTKGSQITDETPPLPRLCKAKKCLRMFKSLSILIFDLNSINGRYFPSPRGILDAIISVTEGLNSLGTLYIARFHKYAQLLRDPKMIPSCSQWPPMGTFYMNMRYVYENVRDKSRVFLWAGGGVLDRSLFFMASLAQDSE